MRVLRLLLLAACLMGLSAAAAWWLWTALPAAPAPVLAAELARIPGPVDGAVVAAQPRRAARWLVRRPQSLVPLVLARPPAEEARRRLEGVLRATAAAAEGPLTLWWRDGQAALMAELPPGARQAVAELAAFQGLVLSEVDGRVLVATNPGLLAGDPAPLPPSSIDPRAALVMVGGRLWEISLTRSTLVAHQGAAAELPETATPPSQAALGDLARWFYTLRADRGSTAPLCLLFGRDAGWAATFPRAALGDTLGRLLGAPSRGAEGAGGDPARWQGLLGTVWALQDGDMLSLMSRRELAGRAAAGPCAGDWGHVTGDDLAYLVERTEGLARIAGLGSRELRTLAHLGESSGRLRSIAWRLDDDGGVLSMKW